MRHVSTRIHSFHLSLLPAYLPIYLCIYYLFVQPSRFPDPGTVSIAAIVFELTSQLSYMLPVLVAVILGRSIGMAASGGLPIYDLLAKRRGILTPPTMNKVTICALSVLVCHFLFSSLSLSLSLSMFLVCLRLCFFFSLVLCCRFN